ncbi:cytochrome P450 93A3-like [Lotus japonicus]|uniref:cytochrome P450 93A3-like n=1 Tax=Lotus japonicus TaxID=34305 RepID=UPI00258F2CC9|nr:cytochrome P450 93A3-like [Lotus japonicus]
MAELQEYLKLLIVWILSTIAVRAILTRKQNKNNRHKNPPSPPSLPIIGHLHLISQIPHQSFHKLSSHYGPIMQLFLGSLPCLVVSSPDMAKEVLKTNESSFSNRFVSTTVHHLSYNLNGFLFAPYGEYWKFVKKLCMSELLGGQTLSNLLPVRQQETLRFLKVLQRKGEAGEAVDVGGELLTLTNSVITRMIMGRACSKTDDDGDVEEIRKMVMDTAELAGKFNVTDFIWFFKCLGLQGVSKRVKEILERFDNMMERVILEHEEERRRRKEGAEGGEIRNLLDILLEIHEDESTKTKLSRENIKALIMDIFMAGTDTSAITMEWALSELIINPEVMEKARNEIDSVTGSSSRLIEESDLPNLPYLRAIVKETLRIHPTSPFIGRESSEKSYICGYEIPEKTLLFVNLWSMGRDPKLWDNPLEFRPERFMGEENNQVDLRGQHFQLMPFGTGRRACPGASLALQVVPTNLAAMVQCFEWKVDGKINMEEKPAITLPRACPLSCVPVPRFS